MYIYVCICVYIWVYGVLLNNQLYRQSIINQLMIIIANVPNISHCTTVNIHGPPDQEVIKKSVA